MNRISYLFFICLIYKACFNLKAEIVLEAAGVSYDPKSGIVSAHGDVHVTQTFENSIKTRELYSDSIEYNRKTGSIKLHGTSIMKEPNGDVLTAKNIILEKKFKDAIAETLIVVLKDSSKIKARKGNKSSNIYTFDNVSYSPCKETSCSHPLWDLVADKAVYDKDKKKFIYKNVRLRIKGTSILFLPYFEHPSFEIKRKTGFLTPIFRRNSDIGLLTGFPLYIAVSPDKSLKFTPFLNSKRRFFSLAEYKQLFEKADFEFSSSFLSNGKKKSISEELTAEEKKEKKEIERRERRARWHIDALIKSHQLENKRISIRLNRASDMTYKSKYPVMHSSHKAIYTEKKYNDSNIMLDFYNKNYFLTTEAHIYQTDEKESAPAIVPHINFNTRGDVLSGELSFDSDTMYLTRNEQKTEICAEKFFRSSNTLKWQKLTNIAPFLLNFNSAIRTDTFDISETNDEADKSNKVQKTFPILENQVSLSIPLESQFRHQISIWNPTISFNSVQTSSKRANIKQREDSVFDNFSDLNLHSIRRFGRYDSIERGERLSLGIENSIYNAKRRWLNFYVGKSFVTSNGDDERFKSRDVLVGRFVFRPTEIFSLRTRFVGMPILEDIRQFETGVTGKYHNITAGVTYMYDKHIAFTQEKGISQLGLNCGYKFNEFWKISMSQIFNLTSHGGKHNLAHSIFASYSDECFKLDFGIFRTNFKHKDIKPKTGIILTIHFKNLGNFTRSGKRDMYNEEVATVE